MEEEFQIHQKLVHDQKQPKVEKEADNCDQKDDVDNKTGELGSIETKETSKEKENSVTKEYFHLPYGWIKEVVSTKNQPSMRGKVREDIYLISPGSNGKKIKSAMKLHNFLEENPNIKCDLEVTSTSKAKHREFLMNKKNPVCQKRFDDPTILIKHDELKLSISNIDYVFNKKSMK